MRAVVSLDGKAYENPLIGVVRNGKTYGVGARRLRKSRTLPARVAHVAAVAEQVFVRLKARCVRVAHAKPEIAQGKERPTIGAVFDGLEKRTRHRGIVAQGWRRTGSNF